jgi:lactoylglutathione lyase
MIKSFRHACVVVKNLDKSLKFYRDILGLKVSKILTAEGKYPQTVLNIKGIKLTYVKMRTKGQPKNSPSVFELHYWKKPKISAKARYNHISFTIQDLDREYKRLSKLGVRFISPPMQAPCGYTQICFGYDPDNNLIEFVEDLKK